MCTPVQISSLASSSSLSSPLRILSSLTASIRPGGCNCCCCQHCYSAYALIIPRGFQLECGFWAMPNSKSTVAWQIRKKKHKSHKARTTTTTRNITLFRIAKIEMQTRSLKYGLRSRRAAGVTVTLLLALALLRIDAAAGRPGIPAPHIYAHTYNSFRIPIGSRLDLRFWYHFEFVTNSHRHTIFNKCLLFNFLFAFRLFAFLCFVLLTSITSLHACYFKLKIYLSSSVWNLC